MCFVISLFPATIWLVVGFFVLYTSNKAEGAIRKFGKILAIWTFVIAALLPICGAVLTISGNCPVEELIEEIREDDDDEDDEYDDEDEEEDDEDD